jgi:aerobic-type carbon monoxide dehydrogenase small subunit (CoxS/CutS family)
MVFPSVRATEIAGWARAQAQHLVTMLDALRDRQGLAGTKKGCDQDACGAWPEPESVNGVVS